MDLHESDESGAGLHRFSERCQSMFAFLLAAGDLDLVRIVFSLNTDAYSGGEGIEIAGRIGDRDVGCGVLSDPTETILLTVVGLEVEGTNDLLHDGVGGEYLDLVHNRFVARIAHEVEHLGLEHGSTVLVATNHDRARDGILGRLALEVNERHSETDKDSNNEPPPAVETLDEDLDDIDGLLLFGNSIEILVHNGTKLFPRFDKFCGVDN